MTNFSPVSKEEVKMGRMPDFSARHAAKHGELQAILNIESLRGNISKKTCLLLDEIWAYHRASNVQKNYFRAQKNFNQRQKLFRDRVMNTIGSALVGIALGIAICLSIFLSLQV